MTTERKQSPFRPGLRNLFGGGKVYVPTDLPEAETAPSQAAGLVSEQGFPVKLPGVNFPPAGSIPVPSPFGDANIAPGATATLLTFAIPDNLRLQLNGIGFGADDEVALRFLTWFITRDNDTVPGFVNMPSGIGSIVQLADISLQSGSSTTVRVVATAAANAVLTYRYICRVSGWLYMERGGPQ
jgi:hypothetical protein